MKHRYVTPTGRSRWFPTIEDARRAATQAGHGHLDRFGAFYSGIFVKFESAPDERDALRKQLRELEDKARSERHAARCEVPHSKASRDAHARARMLESDAEGIRRKLNLPE